MRNHIIQKDMEFIVSSDLPWETLKDNTILITGATGFLASYLVDVFLYLNEEYDYNINMILIVRDISKAKERFSYSVDKTYLQFIQHNLSDDGLIVDKKIDIIFHAASNATPKLFGVDPVGTILPNVIGTNNLLKIAKEHNVKEFFYFSTSGVYGHVNDDSYPIEENCFGGLNSMDVASCYLESKKVAETLCVSYMHQYDIPIKVVRPAITYGPGINENDGRSFADFMWSIANNTNIKLYSDGLVLRNFCYIADAISGFFYILFKGKNGEAYNVASELDISIKDLAYKLTKDIFPEKGLDVEFEYDKSKNYLRKQFNRTTVDTTKVKQLGWEMKYSLEDGFKRSVYSLNKDD